MAVPYDIGYGKPPTNTQFKPGQSGNAKGRTKGSRNLLTDLAKELSQTLIVTEAGKTKRITKQQALIKGLLGKALKGDVRAATALLRLIPASESAAAAAQATQHLSTTDQAILAAFRQQVADELKHDSNKVTDEH